MRDLHQGVVDPAVYGFKAHYLSRIVQSGLYVPKAIAVGPHDVIDLSAIDDDRHYAVRSSGIDEDSAAQSHAGEFRTHLNVRTSARVHEAILDVRASARDEMPMGVVVQEMVTNPRISGIAFSINPITFDLTEATISWVEGLGEDLVGGIAEGNDLSVDITQGTLTEGTWPYPNNLLRQLLDAIVQLDQLLGRPADIEWAVTDTGHLAILQLRPVVLPNGGTFDLGSAHDIARLPSSVRSHHKLQLRALAAEIAVPMSRARAVVADTPTGVAHIEPFTASTESAGRSVVLLHPTHLAGKVIREFTKDCGTDVEFFVRGCQRYAIRQYPEQDGALQAVTDTLARGLQQAAYACVIEQEILHAYATGILRKTADGYLIEAAIGHFVPKGYVETTTFALTPTLELTSQTQEEQTRAYHFLNGHVVVETPPYETLTLSQDDLRTIIETLHPVLEHRPGSALEFGLLGHPGSLSAYLIDVADSDATEAAPTTTDLARGVVSAGTAYGPLTDLRVSSTSDDLNAHLYDIVSAGSGAKLEPAIYVARAASVDLLPLVRAAHPSSGFIFERTSLLAHLPVVLRERGLAAIALPGSDIARIIAAGVPVRIDTGGAHVISPINDPGADAFTGIPAENPAARTADLSTRPAATPSAEGETT